MTATTALASGALASAFLAAPAYAAATTVTVGGVSPSAAINSTTSTLRVNGSGFVAGIDTVTLKPKFTGEAVGNITLTASPQDKANSTPTQLLFSTVDLTKKAPGLYDVEVVQTDAPAPAGNGTQTATCSGCFTITSIGASTVQSVTRGAASSSSNVAWYPGGELNFSGNNIATGAHVTFRNLDGSVDQALSFKPGTSTNGVAAGYVDMKTLQGSYTFTTPGAPEAFTAGRHKIQIDNTDGPFAPWTLDFFQPKFDSTGVVPKVIGAGATSVTLTVSGTGFNPKSTLSFNDSSGCGSNTPDHSVGTTTYSESGLATTVLTAQVTMFDCATAGPRTVTVRGVDGGWFSVGNALTIKDPPVVTSIVRGTIGQGGSFSTDIGGLGFDFGADPAVWPVVTFSTPKVTAKTTAVLDTQHATITVTSAEDAPTGSFNIIITNPSDHGSTDSSSTTNANTNGTTFKVAAGPTITSNPTPGSTPLGTTSQTITVKGANYTSGMSVTLYKGRDANGVLIPSNDTQVLNVTETEGTVNPLAPADDTLTFQVKVLSDAAPGLRDVLIRNNSDTGSKLCVQCFGVDSMSLSPKAGSNTGSLTIDVIGAGLQSTTTAELIKVNDPAYQPHLVGTWVASTLTDGDTSKASAVFNLTNAAPGLYNALVTIDSTHSLACSQCFTVTGQGITVTKITPTSAGQGAVSAPVSIEGTNFSRGEIVSIANVTVHDVAFVDSTHLTAKLDIAGDAPSGTATDVVVTNSDGNRTATLPAAFTINVGPKATDAKNGTGPATWGAGAGTDASKQTITVTGTGFVAGASGAPSTALSLGDGVTVSNVVVVSATSLTADLVVAVDAVPGPRNVMVTNPDAGSNTLTGKVTITAGPHVTAISPLALSPGASNQAITFTGTGFQPNATVALDGVTLTNLSVNADGTSISATASIADTVAPGLVDVKTTNPTDHGFDLCHQCFAIANPPSAPRNASVTSGVQTLTLHWAVPADNGGAPVDGYSASLLAPDADAPVSVGVDAHTFQATFTGLTNGVHYQLTVVAINIAGPGDAAGPIDGVPGLPTTLSNTPLAKIVQYGGTAVVSGRLTSNGAVLGGRTISLKIVPLVGSSFTRLVTTSSTGNWSFSYKAPYTFRITASYAGDDTYQPAATTSLVSISIRVLKSAPASGAKSLATTVLTVTGSVSPNKAGSYIFLYRYTSPTTRVKYAQAKVSSTGTYTLTAKPGKGTYAFRVYIFAVTGNAAGSTSSFTIYRV